MIRIAFNSSGAPILNGYQDGTSVGAVVRAGCVYNARHGRIIPRAAGVYLRPPGACSGRPISARCLFSSMASFTVSYGVIVSAANDPSAAQESSTPPKAFPPPPPPNRAPSRMHQDHHRCRARARVRRLPGTRRHSPQRLIHRQIHPHAAKPGIFPGLCEPPAFLKPA